MKRSLKHLPDRVLVIDNNTPGVIACALSHKLTHTGYEIILTSGSYEGIKAFRQTPDRYRMIIIDIGIQDIPGIDLARLILDFNPRTSVVIHAQSGDILIKISKKGIRVKKLPQNILQFSS